MADLPDEVVARPASDLEAVRAKLLENDAAIESLARELSQIALRQVLGTSTLEDAAIVEQHAALVRERDVLRSAETAAAQNEADAKVAEEFRTDLSRQRALSQKV